MIPQVSSTTLLLFLKMFHKTTSSVRWVCVGFVNVKCSQTGKELVVKARRLSRGDGQPLTKSDFICGSSLMLQENEKDYPVQFVGFPGIIILYMYMYLYRLVP